MSDEKRYRNRLFVSRPEHSPDIIVRVYSLFLASDTVSKDEPMVVYYGPENNKIYCTPESYFNQKFEPSPDKKAEFQHPVAVFPGDISVGEIKHVPAPSNLAMFFQSCAQTVKYAEALVDEGFIPSVNIGQHYRDGEFNSNFGINRSIPIKGKNDDSAAS